MKFDFCIGNPPYQNSVDTYNRQEPVYPFFYDSAESVADKYILISPARFLFNAGLTPKEWNQKMLEDSHLKHLPFLLQTANLRFSLLKFSSSSLPARFGTNFL